MTPQAKQVLLVDDEERLLESIAQRMRILGFTPHTAINGMAAIDIARKQPIDLAIVDLQMPDMDGLVVITKLKEIDPGLKTVLLTGHGNEKVKQATESLNTLYFEKDEMSDFWRFVKKLNEGGQVVVIQPAGASAKTMDAPVTIAPPNGIGARAKDGLAGAAIAQMGMATPGVSEGAGRLRIVGETPAMQDLRKSIARAASLDCTVTLKGEPGTGKELGARAIHAESLRRRKRFLAIDCANFNNAQLAGQILGFAGGNLYDAIRTHSGIFGADPVGTLFLDQVEMMPGHMQDQLLTTLNMNGNRQSGGPEGSGLDIRIIVATETDLAERTRTGAFKKGLFNRLNVFELTLPPLRERKDDIHPLVRYFFDKYRRELGKPVDAISPEVVETLVAYDYPGNVRELEHIIERAVIIADSKTIARSHLPARFLEEAKPKPAAPGPFATLAELEKRYIVEVLDASNGNKSKTAEILGISRAALWRKLKQLKAEKPGD